MCVNGAGIVTPDIVTPRFYLNIPFQSMDKAKYMEAKWDPITVKLWYNPSTSRHLFNA